ncbi:hypothetical protein OS21_05890 [Dickeya oryzae]
MLFILLSVLLLLALINGIDSKAKALFYIPDWLCFFKPIPIVKYQYFLRDF